MAVGHPGAQHRLVHDARVAALQPMVPPAQHLLQEADLRPGPREMRIGMRPRSDQPLARRRQMLEQARDGIGVAVGPAADRIDRTLDRGVVLAHRAVPPIGVAMRMLQPALEEQRQPAQPLEPQRPPAVADQRGIGRMAHVGEEEARPAEAGVELGAAHVMHVVAIAIVGRAQRDDRLERRRPARRDLQRVEATPRDAEHADCAAAPRLGRQPGDDLERVVLLLPAVLVGQHAVGLARAADVDAHGGVAVAGEVRMGERVPLRRPVALAVGQILEQGGDGGALRVLRQPQPRGEAGAVGERDPGVLDLADAAGEGRHQTADSSEVSVVIARRSFPAMESAESSLAKRRDATARGPSMGPHAVVAVWPAIIR